MKLFIATTITLYCSFFGVFGQQNSGGIAIENAIVYVSPETSKNLYAEHLYFGPNAHWIIDGVVEVWCEKIWFAPTAKMEGTGKLIIHSSADNPFPSRQVSSTPTLIDGNNGQFISLLMEIRNDQGIHLVDLSDPGFGTRNPSASEAAKLNLDTELDLAVDGASIYLRQHHLALSARATIANAGQQRMIVTENSNKGHVIKRFNNSDNSSFLVPIGVAQGDYTPVTLFHRGGSGDVYTTVVARNQSPFQFKEPTFAIQRAWNIYSPSAGVQVDLLLDHSSHQGTQYDESLSSIIQHTGSAKFEFLATQRRSEGADFTAGVELALRNYDDRSWFSKYSGFEEGFSIPSVLSPNGDGINDTFTILGLYGFDAVRFTVFDPNGRQVYTNPNYDNSWTGQGLPEGTYYYGITVTKGSYLKNFKGYLVLRRSL